MIITLGLNCFNVINDVSNTSLKGLCRGCLPHYDDVAKYRIYSNKRRTRLSVRHPRPRITAAALIKSILILLGFGTESNDASI